MLSSGPVLLSSRALQYLEKLFVFLLYMRRLKVTNAFYKSTLLH